MPSTPVNTSTYSLPASFALSNAPLKSPSKTFLNASAKKPTTSNALLKRSIMLSFIAMPNAFIFCNGFSKTDLKKLTFHSF